MTNTDDLAAFRRRCGQFRWLAVFMVVSVGAILVLIHVISPVVLWLRDGRDVQSVLSGVIRGFPVLCYLFGVWSIGSALGQISKGRLIQPILSAALRRVGLALGVGAVFNVFVVTNLLRMIGAIKGGYLFFDVASMTLGMIGGALFLLGRVVDEAAAAQAELDEMI